MKFLDLDIFPEKNISSPFSEDKKPSFKLYRDGKFKCFSTGKQGDVFQFVADLNGLDSKTQFPEIKKIIFQKFGLHHNTISSSLDRRVFESTKLISAEKKEHLKLLHHFEWLSEHLDFWQKYGVSAQLLRQYCVRPLKYFEFLDSQDNLKKFSLQNKVAFSYQIGDRFEIYIPQQEKTKKFFLSKHTNADIFGFSELKKGKPTIICAGKKDCLTLIASGFQAVSFKSEATNPSLEQINELRQFGPLFICYDNDFDNKINNGQQRQSELAKKFNLIAIDLPKNINDIADLYVSSPSTFREYIQKKLNNSLAEKDQQNNQQLTTIFHVAEDYLSKKYEIRKNTVKLDIEIRRKRSQEKWQPLNENSLFVELQKSGININMDRLLALLKSDFTPEFNPFQDYFESLAEWDGKDYIQELANHVEADDQKAFNHHFKKWLVRSVKCTITPEYFNKQAFVLVHNAQNSGKSTFCRFLCPPSLNQYIAEDISNDKDARILLCKNFLINLDELAVLSRQEINSLKSYFSKTQVNERLPYDRKNSIIPRTCSFIGSTNMDEFLSDETGSVRWLCFNIRSINWRYKKTIDINQVWTQAFALAKDSSFDSELSKDEIEENERRNKNFEVISNERALIQSFLKKPSEASQGEFATSTDILIYLQNWSGLNRLNNVSVGKALKQEGFEKIKKYNGNKIQQWGYMILKTKI